MRIKSFNQVNVLTVLQFSRFVGSLWQQMFFSALVGCEVSGSCVGETLLSGNFRNTHLLHTPLTEVTMTDTQFFCSKRLA